MADTIPGGKYITAAGYWQNAEGQWIDDDGKVVTEPIKANEKKERAVSAPKEQANDGRQAK